jgi:hypothetical protein
MKGFGSSLERDFLILLDFDLNVDRYPEIKPEIRAGRAHALLVVLELGGTMGRINVIFRTVRLCAKSYNFREIRAKFSLDRDALTGI